MNSDRHQGQVQDAPDQPHQDSECIAPQRVVFVGKYSYDATAGNSVAIRRLIDGYRDRGLNARYVVAGGSVGDAAFSLFGGQPDLVHALHAGEAAEFAAELAKAFEVPLVITLTGTDWGPDGPGAGVLDRLRVARGVVALSDYQRRELFGSAPEVPVAVIPQAVVLGSEPFDLREALTSAVQSGLGDRRIALLPGGLRPVKGQGLALDAFEHCAKELRDWFLVIAGPVLDEDFAKAIRDRARSSPNVLYVGVIPHEAMPAAMRSSDVVLNTSDSEGEPQTILEAQCVGVPVVARRIEGNEALVQDRVTGWLFDDYKGLGQRLVEISRDLERGGETVGDVVTKARAATTSRLDAAREVDEHLAFYRALLS